MPVISARSSQNPAAASSLNMLGPTTGYSWNESSLPSRTTGDVSNDRQRKH
jgi:hypothetical protein